MLIRDTNIKVDRDRCIACGICVDRCIMDNLRLSVSPCRQVCPLHIDCQGFIRLLAQGKEQEAFEVLGKYLPFMSLLSLLCHAPCEKVCARKKVDRPVQIRDLYGYLFDQKLELSQIEEGISKNKKVAILGSGPAALMAEWCLKRSGYDVTLLERTEEIGGSLRIHMAESQNHHKTIQALLDTIIATGVEIKTNIGTFDYNATCDSYDAVVITHQSDGDLSRLKEQNRLDAKRLQPDQITFQSADNKKIFICKEFSEELRLVNALANGKTIFESVKRFLTGVPLGWERGFWEAQGNEKSYMAPFEKAKHVRLKNKQLSDIGTREEVLQEAERCLGCGRPFDANQTCWYCLPCEIDCPHSAIEVQIPFLLR